MNWLWLLLLALNSSSPHQTGPPDNPGALQHFLQATGHAIVEYAATGRQTGPASSPPYSAGATADPQPEAPAVKGIYVTAYSAGGAKLDKLIDLLDHTDLNAMVIDLKDDAGQITYPTTNPKLLKYGSPHRFIPDIDKLLQRLKQHDIYPIARIVVFKDTLLAEAHPELSFTQADGTLWQNANGDSFVNPYSSEVWDYNIELAKEAARLGFKEIQFDYVRFPEGFENKADNLHFFKTAAGRTDQITAFLKTAKQELAPFGVRVSADIFGYAASVPAAEGIGQDFNQIAENVNVVSPMIYPSHYSTGWFGLKDPDKAPYQTVKGAIADTHKKIDMIHENQPIIRPWIQDFTAAWLGSGHYIPYGEHEVEEQIRALSDMGVKEYLLWNAGNRYSVSGANDETNGSD